MLLNVPEVHQAHVQRALIWLAFSRVPMTLGQVAEAVLISREQQSMDPGDQFRDVHDLLELCSSFVCLVGTPHLRSRISICLKRFGREHITSDADFVLRLAHSSVKEYMLSDRTSTTSLSMPRLTSGIAQRLMAEVCLIYLNQFNDETLISPEILERHQFLSYAGQNWYLHYEDMPAEEEDNVVDLLLCFMKTHYNRCSYNGWVGLLPFYLNYGSIKTMQPLVALSMLGSYRAVKAMVENAVEVHVTEDIIRGSLGCASWEGQEAVVRLLLDIGARSNRAGVIDASSLSQALGRAGMRGNSAVIELLISRGATAEGLDYSFVSRVAGRQGKVHTVKLFLDLATTNCNKMEVFYGALQGAINARQSSIVQYLLERSAEIDITAGEDLCFPTLLRASFEGDDSTVQLLIGQAFGPKAMDIRRAKLKVLDTSWTPRTKLLLLQILGAGIDHRLLEKNHERDYIPIGNPYWENVVETEDTIKERLLEEKKLLEEEELIEEAKDLLQRIRSLSTVASPTTETESDDMSETESEVETESDAMVEQ